MPEIFDTVEQGSELWRRIRAGLVSASRFKDATAGGSGATRKSYMYQLATELLTGKPVTEFDTTAWMERGLELEQEAREAYEFRTGMAVRQVAFVRSGDFENVGCSPDGMVGEQGLVEIKCPKLVTHVGYIIDDRLPPAYKKQVQGQLWVTEREWCDFVSYHPESNVPLWVKRVERDEPFIQAMRNDIARFNEELLNVVNILKEAGQNG